MNDLLEQAQAVVDAKSVVQDVLEAKTQIAEAVTSMPSTEFVPYIADITGQFASSAPTVATGDAITDAINSNIKGTDYKDFAKESGIHTIGDGLVGIGAGAAMIGASGVGAGQGIAAGRAAEAVGRNPEAEGKIRMMFILGVGIAESAAIYALIVSILLLFVF